MEFELTCLPNSIRRNYTNIVNRYRNDYEELSKKYRQLQIEKHVYVMRITLINCE